MKYKAMKKVNFPSKILLNRQTHNSAERGTHTHTHIHTGKDSK